MINFFDNLRFWGTRRNKLLSSLYFYQGMNFISTVLANLALPLYFQLTKAKYHLTTCDRASGRIIVSLTTFPRRIKTVHLVIESMLHQTRKPDKIILYLTRSQVPSLDTLPKHLLALCPRGLEIVLCDDPIRSHTKYYYAFRDYPDDLIVTVDDDIIYRTDLIENLIAGHERFPKSIITNWAKKIQSDDENNSFYNHWPEASQQDALKEFNRLLLFGVAGVLYPPHCMYRDCLNPDLIQSLSLTADDIWLSCMAILQGTTFVYTGYKQNHLPVIIEDNQTLLAENRVKNQVCVDHLNSYYKDTAGFRPFIDLTSKEL